MTYGFGRGDSGFLSPNEGGSVNYSLGFAFRYLNTTYTNIEVNVNGFVLLDSSAFVSVYTNTFSTNSSGYVYTRAVNSSVAGGASDLATVSQLVRSTYPVNYTWFTASNAFVVTWAGVSLASSASQINTFQLALVTDMSNSFLVFYYVRTDSTSQSTCAYVPANNASFLQVTLSTNCTQGSSLVALVNAGGLNLPSFFISDAF